MGVCFDFLYSGGVPDVRIPLFNIVLSICPFIFLSFLLLRTEEQNKKALPRKQQTIAIVRSSQVYQSETPQTTKKHRPLLKMIGFDGTLLSQYFTLVRFLTLLDFVAMMILLIASNFEQTWFRVSSVIIRVLYGLIEYAVLVTLVLPVYQHKTDPRRIVFSWFPVQVISLVLSIPYFVINVNRWAHCESFIPQYDITFATPSYSHNQSSLFNDYIEGQAECEKTPEDWLYHDLFDAFVFAFFALLPFIKMSKPNEKFEMVLSAVHEIQIPFTNLSIYPRKCLAYFSGFLLITRIFRIAGDLMAISMKESFGGPFLCMFGIGYVFEQAFFAPILMWTLIWDSTFLFSGSKEDQVRHKFIQFTDDADSNHEIDFSEIHLEERIGSGQYEVYKAFWHGTPCAVKRIPYRTILHIEGVDFFKYMKNELLILSSLRHPNIVQFLGYCPCAKVALLDEPNYVDYNSSASNSESNSVEQNSPLLLNNNPDFVDDNDPSVSKELWIVMEFLPKKSLRGYIESPEAIINIERIVKISLDICRGMCYLIQKGVLHCDLKSLNIFVGDHDEIKIGDFSESHLIDGLKMADSTSGVRTFSSDRAYGSIHWMAPESIEKNQFSERSDVYSFGIVLWELITRRTPYSDIDMMETGEFKSDQKSAFELKKKVVSEGLRPTIPEDCPHNLKVIMKKCWENDPSKRPTFNELLQMLEKVHVLPTLEDYL